MKANPLVLKPLIEEGFRCGFEPIANRIREFIPEPGLPRGHLFLGPSGGDAGP